MSGKFVVNIAKKKKPWEIVIWVTIRLYYKDIYLKYSLSVLVLLIRPKMALLTKLVLTNYLVLLLRQKLAL